MHLFTVKTDSWQIFVDIWFCLPVRSHLTQLEEEEKACSTMYDKNQAIVHKGTVVVTKAVCLFMVWAQVPTLYMCCIHSLSAVCVLAAVKMCRCS